MSDKDSTDERDEAEEASTEDAAPAEDESSSEAEERPQLSKKLRNKARREEEARALKKRATTLAVGIGAVALVAGGAAGWFGHVAQAKAKVRNESPMAAGSAVSGPCGTWQEKICTSSGAQSSACMQAKGATGLLTAGTCEVALEAIPATLAKVKAERVPCDTLSSKLCKDLPPESPTCSMIKERTPSFPRERCEEMLKNYEQVLNEVKMMEQQQGGMQMGAPGHGGPPGGPPGGPHGADDGHGH